MPGSTNSLGLQYSCNKMKRFVGLLEQPQGHTWRNWWTNVKIQGADIKNTELEHLLGAS